MTIEKDIVKVLRTMRPSIIPDLWTSILNEAADEIEKLRKAARNILTELKLALFASRQNKTRLGPTL